MKLSVELDMLGAGWENAQPLTPGYFVKTYEGYPIHFYYCECCDTYSLELFAPMEDGTVLSIASRKIPYDPAQIDRRVTDFLSLNFIPKHP